MVLGYEVSDRAKVLFWGYHINGKCHVSIKLQKLEAF